MDKIFNHDDIISEFKEDFEIDLKEDSYEKIVPNLPLTNSARFIHDFSAVCFNQELYLSIYSGLLIIINFILECHWYCRCRWKTLFCDAIKS
jgi:hypothetical protein